MRRERLEHEWRLELRDERIIQVPGCDDCTGVGHDKNLVVVVVVVVTWAGPST